MIVTDLWTQIVHLGFRNCILVRVTTDTGITGISETVMKRWSLTIEQSILQLRSYLIGKDPTNIEDHWEKMYRDSFWVGGPMHSTAISAIDCALWDILAKSLGFPVHNLLVVRRGSEFRSIATALAARHPRNLQRIFWPVRETAIERQKRLCRFFTATAKQAEKIIRAPMAPWRPL